MSGKRLFVYGSLQPGGVNAHVLEELRGEWMRAIVRGRLLELGWGAAIGFPGLIIDDDGDDVPGFVFVSDALADDWERLDEFEGPQYRRVQCNATLSCGEVVRASVYVVTVDNV